MTRYVWNRWVGLVLVLGTSAALAGRTRSVVYGDPLATNFSHVKHSKVGCDFCHGTASRSRRADDVLLPGKELCTTCHAEKSGAPKELLGAAGTGGLRQLRFDHAAHAQKQISCQRCHLGSAELDAGRGLPKMADCQTCHDSRRMPLHAASRCQTCHLAEPDGMLTTQLATGALIPKSGDLMHSPSFRTDHSRVAGARSANCESCHRQDFCQSCHNGIVKPLDFHGNDFLTRHPVDARRASAKCQSCHRPQTFCLGCHERAGVGGGLPGQAFLPGAGAAFHPSGFQDDHGSAARRNLRTCASCHREDSCMECHSTMPGGKSKTSPHPSSWRGSVRCQSLVEKNPRVCQRCHDDATCTP